MKNKAYLYLTFVFVVMLAFVNIPIAKAVDTALYNVKDYGATGDGVTDDRQAIQDAINAAEATGGTVYFPGGNYLLKKPSISTKKELLLITKQIRIQGSGFRSQLLVENVNDPVPNDVDVIRISPGETTSGIDTAYSPMWYFTIDGITIFSKNWQQAAPARHGIHLDVDQTGQFLAKMVIENNRIGQFGGSGIKLSNTAKDGLFTSVIQDNAINGGLDLTNSGDSLNIIGNTITGENIGIHLKSVRGAAHTVIAYNNITSKGGAIKVIESKQLKILHNQIEQTSTLEGADQAMINIIGAVDYPVTLTEIIGNNMNAYGNISNNIRLVLVENTAIDNNNFGNSASGGSMIKILAEAKQTHIGGNNVFLGKTYSDAISDSGVGTTGVKKEAVLQNSWVNFSVAHESAGYFKDDSGMVHLSGLIKDGTNNAVNTIFQLQAGFRPIKTHSFPVVSDQVGTKVLGMVQVSASGVVSFINGGNSFFSLDGISFSTNY